MQAHIESDVKFDLRTMRASAMEGKFVITLCATRSRAAFVHVRTDYRRHNIEFHAPNVRFHFHKKTFPKLHDSGHVDLDAKVRSASFDSDETNASL